MKIKLISVSLFPLKFNNFFFRESEALLHNRPDVIFQDYLLYPSSSEGREAEATMQFMFFNESLRVLSEEESVSHLQRTRG